MDMEIFNTDVDKELHYNFNIEYGLLDMCF